MNYYEEMIGKIEELLKEKNYESAEKMISDELSVAYVPRDIEKKLYHLKEQIIKDTSPRKLSDEELEEYLFEGDPDHQLLSVNELNGKNLRQYIDLCQRYFESEGFANAKALLIDSLIRQEISHVFQFKRGEDIISFNPCTYAVIEDSEPFLAASAQISIDYMKEPSKLQLARQLLYKELIMALPDTYSVEQALVIEKNIVAYINNAFDSAE
ncbi:MAG: DUF3196 family protein [Erysipelotrichaceae bacterium]|nr:DUF3196 family protein [Erysipelotrichaceae bacterium]